MTAPATVADRLKTAGYPMQAAAITPGGTDPATAAAAAAAGAASASIGGVNLGPLTSAADMLANVSAVTSSVVKAGNWISNRRNWVRIAYVAGGVSLVLGALLLVVQGAASSRGGRALGAVVTKGKLR